MADGIIDLGDTPQRIVAAPNPRRRRDKIRAERGELRRLLGGVDVPGDARHDKNLRPPGNQPGTFLDLSEDEKLSRPSFEPMPAGARIRPPGEAAAFDAAREADLRYETFVCDDEGMRGRRSKATLDSLLASSARTALAAGAAGRSELRAATRYRSDPDPIVLAHPGEVVVVSKVTVEAAAPEAWTTYSHAAEQPLADDAQLARLGVAA